ncbi:hypothetical protein BUALT_Bualt07G0091800 [Buddleja alternifolia]|uniref:Non-structural maintenance of chromosomes element 4 n=1 Tax=Buddleja alternifolia TaxID=168488 RepID=A0AAV6XK94_9LAMI|nr:hypothetical protein BUALT_Bualt07G0091800 [Buddleja alternifolia]
MEKGPLPLLQIEENPKKSVGPSHNFPVTNLAISNRMYLAQLELSATYASNTFTVISCGMIGPMDIELNQRNNLAPQKRTRPMEDDRPEQLDKTANEDTTDNDNNMATRFDILSRNRNVKLENLVLNRNSFAQTVKNLFALSHLVKNGRAEIKLDENGYHLVFTRNAPTANAILSGEATYSHFIFRFDFGD